MYKTKSNVPMRVSRIIRGQLHISQFRGKHKASQEARYAYNRRKLDEYGDKLIREHRDEFIDIDDL